MCIPALKSEHVVYKWKYSDLGKLRYISALLRQFAETDTNWLLYFEKLVLLVMISVEIASWAIYAGFSPKRSVYDADKVPWIFLLENAVLMVNVMTIFLSMYASYCIPDTYENDEPPKAFMWLWRFREFNTTTTITVFFVYFLHLKDLTTMLEVVQAQLIICFIAVLVNFLFGATPYFFEHSIYSIGLYIVYWFLFTPFANLILELVMYAEVDYSSNTKLAVEKIFKFLMIHVVVCYVICLIAYRKQLAFKVQFFTGRVDMPVALANIQEEEDVKTQEEDYENPRI
jgi:hypothetical protein